MELLQFFYFFPFEFKVNLAWYAQQCIFVVGIRRFP
jgi:hypothetical protein